MRDRTIIILFALLILPATLFAGTLFEDEKKTSDPYVGERGGFNSLFVNPAGAAGQSGFELSVNVGARSKVNDVKLLMGMTDMAMAMADSGGSGTTDVQTLADASQALVGLVDSGVIDQALVDSLFGGTSLDWASVDWTDPAAVQTAAEGLTTGAGSEMDTIEQNLAGVVDGSNAAFYAALPGEISVDALASFKTGFLIKGFGLGIYDQAMGVAFMDSASQEYGIKTIYNELGVIAGGGFNLFEGKLAVGFSGNYGMLMKNASPVGFDNFNSLISDPNTINYGYTWGVDLGAVWRPTPALGVGITFNDVIGYTQVDTPYTADGIMGIIDSGAYLMDDVQYEFTMDMDAGITWQPDWRFVRPKLSFDMYNVIGYAEDVAENGDNFEQAMNRTLSHMRFGANFTFFEFLKIGTQYYDHYLSVGAGLDLLFLELYGEVKVNEEVFYNSDINDVPIGGDLMVRLHF
ncbi:MAG: hypothetical protein DRP70_15075 [Spirochaetes bacterium]|nr:MAG: hypothetical protein DRP70_15075 [Spirochaetota bacterium]